MSETDPLNAPVQWLYPAPAQEVPLKGLYLNTQLLPDDVPDSEPWCYANFVASVDGRIAAEGETRTRVPADVANPRDWRLFQELAAKADCLLTSGRYLRELEQGTAQDVLPVGSAFTDLLDWRRRNGLRPQPDVAVMSTSGDFRIPPELRAEGRRVWVLLPSSVSAETRDLLESQGAHILQQPTKNARLRGIWVREALTETLEYRRIYSAGGPRIAHALMDDGVLDSLYLTTRHCAIGGTAYETCVEGARLVKSFYGELRCLILDPGTESGPGQHFQRYDRLRDGIDDSFA